MSRIALVLTGGTIGSSECRSALRAEEGTEFLLLKKYREKGGTAAFDVVRSETMLSENFSEDVMLKIARELADLCEKDYRAAVVATGTDNLGYFSVLLSFLLASVKIPIFIISSQFILTDKRENGSDHLRAVDAAVRRLSRGVYVLNRNLEDSFVSVLRAVRVNQCLAPTGDFISVYGRIAKIAKGRFHSLKSEYSEMHEFYEGRKKTFENTLRVPKELGTVAVYSQSVFRADASAENSRRGVFAFVSQRYRGNGRKKFRSSVFKRMSGEKRSRLCRPRFFRFDKVRNVVKAIGVRRSVFGEYASSRRGNKGEDFKFFGFFRSGKGKIFKRKPSRRSFRKPKRMTSTKI